MEQIKLGKTIKRKFYITNQNNNLVNVDTPPGATGLLYREDADSGAVVSISAITTGVYGASVGILGVNGFIKDSIGELEIAATVSGILVKNSIWAGIVESSDVDDLPNISALGTGVWGFTGIRSLSDKVGFGVTGIPVLADNVTGIWGAPSRTLTDKAGYSTTGLPSISDVATGVWGYGGGRALTDKTVFGVTGIPVLADMVTGIWGAPSRTLTDKVGYSTTGISIPSLGDIATGVWGFTGIRSLSDKVNFGVTGVSVNLGDIATGVWGYTGIRSLSDKVGFGVTGIPVLADVVTGIWGAPSRTLTDKAGYSTTGISIPSLGDIATGVWGFTGIRSLNDKVGFGVTGIPVLADNVTGIWGAPSRTLTGKTGFGVTGLPNLADIATGVWGYTGIRSLYNDNVTRLVKNKQVWEYVGGVYTGTVYLRNDGDTANILKTIARDPTTGAIITDPNYTGPMNFDAWSTP